MNGIIGEFRIGEDISVALDAISGRSRHRHRDQSQK